MDNKIKNKIEELRAQVPLRTTGRRSTEDLFFPVYVAITEQEEGNSEFLLYRFDFNGEVDLTTGEQCIDITGGTRVNKGDIFIVRNNYALPVSIYRGFVNLVSFGPYNDYYYQLTQYLLKEKGTVSVGNKLPDNYVVLGKVLSANENEDDDRCYIPLHFCDMVAKDALGVRGATHFSTFRNYNQTANSLVVDPEGEIYKKNGVNYMDSVPVLDHFPSTNVAIEPYMGKVVLFPGKHHSGNSFYCAALDNNGLGPDETDDFENCVSTAQYSEFNYSFVGSFFNSKVTMSNLDTTEISDSFSNVWTPRTVEFYYLTLLNILTDIYNDSELAIWVMLYNGSCNLFNSTCLFSVLNDTLISALCLYENYNYYETQIPETKILAKDVDGKYIGITLWALDSDEQILRMLPLDQNQKVPLYWLEGTQLRLSGGVGINDYDSCADDQGDYLLYQLRCKAGTNYNVSSSSVVGLKYCGMLRVFKGDNHSNKLKLRFMCYSGSGSTYINDPTPHGFVLSHSSDFGYDSYPLIWSDIPNDNQITVRPEVWKVGNTYQYIEVDVSNYFRYYNDEDYFCIWIRPEDETELVTRESITYLGDATVHASLSWVTDLTRNLEPSAYFIGEDGVLNRSWLGRTFSAWLRRLGIEPDLEVDYRIYDTDLNIRENPPTTGNDGGWVEQENDTDPPTYTTTGWKYDYYQFMESIEDDTQHQNADLSWSPYFNASKSGICFYEQDGYYYGPILRIQLDLPEHVSHIELIGASTK